MIIKYFLKNNKIYKINIKYNINLSLRLTNVYIKIEN